MIEVREGQTVLGTYASFSDAKAYVQALGVVFMEDDKDHNNCADAFLMDGRIVAIQPEGFKL